MSVRETEDKATTSALASLTTLLNTARMLGDIDAQETYQHAIMCVSDHDSLVAERDKWHTVATRRGKSTLPEMVRLREEQGALVAVVKAQLKAWVALRTFCETPDALDKDAIWNAANDMAGSCEDTLAEAGK